MIDEFELGFGDLVKGKKCKEQYLIVDVDYDWGGINFDFLCENKKYGVVPFDKEDLILVRKINA